MHFTRIFTIQIMHQPSQFRIFSIASRHIDNMRLILEILLDFLYLPFHMIDRKSVAQHITSGNENNIAFWQFAKVLPWFQRIHVQQPTMVSCSLGRCPLIFMLKLYIYFFSFCIHSHTIQNCRFSLQILIILL